MHPLLQEGLIDALGFVAGALLGWWIGEALGLPLFAEGHGNASLLAIALVGLGGGLGVQAARRWGARQT
jgi:hypothetical protein